MCSTPSPEPGPATACLPHDLAPHRTPSRHAPILLSAEPKSQSGCPARGGQGRVLRKLPGVDGAWPAAVPNLRCCYRAFDPGSRHPGPGPEPRQCRPTRETIFYQLTRNSRKGAPQNTNASVLKNLMSNTCQALANKLNRISFTRCL